MNLLLESPCPAGEIETRQCSTVLCSTNLLIALSDLYLCAVELLNFLFSIGIVFIILSFIWGLFMLVLNVFTLGERKGVFEEYLLKAVNFYILASLTAMVALEQSTYYATSHYGYEVAGGIMLYLYLVSKFERQRFKFMVQSGMRGMQMHQEQTSRTANTVFLVGTLALYITSLGFPEIINNNINQWFITTIRDIYDTPIIGFIIKVIGFFFLLNIIFRGIQQTQLLIAKINNKIEGNSNHKKDDDDFDDYEIVE